MSAVANPPPLRETKRWTVEAYLALCESGHIRPDERVELLEGEIVEKMSQNFPHIDGVRLLVDALRAAFGLGFNVSAQLPVRTPDSVPEPDAMVLRGTARDFIGRFPKPEEIVLVAEVADSSLPDDRARKSRIYARAGFAEYWILNVVDRQLEVHRAPAGGVYGEILVCRSDFAVTIEGREIRVADLLP